MFEGINIIVFPAIKNSVPLRFIFSASSVPPIIYDYSSFLFYFIPSYALQGTHATITDGQLNISSAVPTDMGFYRCDASNGVGPTASAQAYLNVTCQLKNKFIDALTNFLIKWLIEVLTDWLFHWLTNGMM